VHHLSDISKDLILLNLFLPSLSMVILYKLVLGSVSVKIPQAIRSENASSIAWGLTLGYKAQQESMSCDCGYIWGVSNG
jgi:hypothetical protein